MNITLKPRFRELSWTRLQKFGALFFENLAENRRLMMLAAGGGMGAAAMRLLRPWPVKLLFDGVLIPDTRLTEQPMFAWLLGHSTNTVILAACGGLLAITLLWSLFSYAQTYLTARAGQLAVYSLRQRVYSHLLRLSLGFHQRRRRGDLVMRLTGDINLLRDMMVDSALLVMSEGMMLVAMVVVMLAMDVPLSLAALSILPLMALTTLRFSVRIRDAARRQRQKEGRVAAMVSEMLRSVHLIQAFGREEEQADRFQQGNRMSLKAGLKTTRLEASMSRIVEVLLALGTAAVLWLGVHRVRAGVLTPGDLLVFTSYLHGSYRPLRKLARVASRMSKAVVCADRVVEVLGSAPEVTEHPDAKKARDVRGLVEFRRVSFDYRGGRRGTHRVSFSAQPGQLIGIAGPSGAGKSTLLALMLRLYDPKKGKVLLDGRELRRLRLSSMRDQVSVILQEPMIFGSTIRDNISFADPSAGDEDVERAAKLANAHEFICELPHGYDTPVAECGASLSSGQRQRLAIARAFLRDSPVLLMDEPTQGLDAASEYEVNSALRRLMRGRTTILVAHKLEMLRAADEILVLKSGKVIERGSHEELIAHDGWYRRGTELQRGDTDGATGEGSTPPPRKVVAFAPRWRQKDDHLRASAAAQPGALPRFDPAILDPDAVAEALATAGVRPAERGPLRLQRAWPLPRVDLMTLFDDPGAGRQSWWSVHAVSGRIPGPYREALRRGDAVMLEKLDAIGWAFPSDPSLLGLGTLGRARKAEIELRPWFRQECETWTRVRASVIGYKPTRRCVIRYRLVLPDGGRTFYGKCFYPGGAEEVWKTHRRLARARRSDRLAALNVAAPLGVVSGYEMVLWRKQAGVRFHDLLGTEEAVAGVPKVAALLANLQRSSTAWHRLHTRERELGTTAWWARTAAAAFGAQRDLVESSIDTLRRRAERAAEGPPVPSHRDFYDKQVILHGDTAVLLDLETASRAEPELDVANFLAHLELRALQGAASGLENVAAEFLDAYSVGCAVPDRDRLSFYRSSALLRLSCVYALRRGAWTDLSSSLADRALSAPALNRKLVGG